MAGSCPQGFVYTVQPGDTLYLLAQRFGVSVDALFAANPGVDPWNLQVGMTLCVPTHALAPPPPCSSGIFWQVAPGDTFWTISQRFGISVQELMAANPGLSPSNIPVGTVLCIPRVGQGAPPTQPAAPARQPLPPCPSGVYWEVSPGETLFTIARRTGVSLNALLQANPGVDPGNLQPGQSICVPG